MTMLRPAKPEDQSLLMDENGEIWKLNPEQQQRLADVKNRVLKLLAQAKGEGTTEAERETAMAFAIQAARKHGFDVYRLEKEAGRERDAFALRQLELGGHSHWRVQLVNCIAQALICKLILHYDVQFSNQPNKRSGNTIRRPRSNYVSLIGMPQDIEMLDYIYEYLVGTAAQPGALLTMAEEAFRANDVEARQNGFKVSGKAYRDNFYRGAVRSIGYRLTDLFRQEEEDDEDAEEDTSGVPSDMALMPLKKADLDNAAEKRFGKMKADKATYKAKGAVKHGSGHASDRYGYGLDGIYDPKADQKQRGQRLVKVHEYGENAYMRGYEAGKNVPLHKPIADQQPAGALPSGE